MSAKSNSSVELGSLYWQIEVSEVTSNIAAAGSQCIYCTFMMLKAKQACFYGFEFIFVVFCPSSHCYRTADPVPAPQNTGVASGWRGATAASTCPTAAPRWPLHAMASSSRTCWQACARREPSRSKTSSSIFMARTR